MIVFFLCVKTPMKMPASQNVGNIVWHFIYMYFNIFLHTIYTIKSLNSSNPLTAVQLQVRQSFKDDLEIIFLYFSMKTLFIDDP